MGSAATDDGKPAAAPPSSPRAAISHVIFDMDGLLLNTDGMYTAVQEKIMARYGKVFDWSIKAQTMGTTTTEATRILFEKCVLDGLLTMEQFQQERDTMLQELLPTCSLMPGAVQLIDHLHANGIPFCVATGTHKDYFAVKTQNHQELFSLMHHVVTGDDPEVSAGKPCPDIFLAAMRRFEHNVEPCNCLVFEDAPLGVTAAKNAGMNVVMVPHPRLDVSYHKEADQVLSSILDFNPRDWGLPPFAE